MIFLDENYIGLDTEIGFPHLLLCMGFVAVIGEGVNKSLCGIHLTSTEDTKKVFPIFADHLKKTGERINCIYGSCNRLVRYGAAEESLWREEMTFFAKTLDFKGEAMGFDTGIIEPRDGTYVEYHLDPTTEKCKIWYRQNDRVEFSHDSSAPMGLKVELASNSDFSKLPEAARLKAEAKNLHLDRIESTPYATSGINKLIKGRGLFAKGKLREVDYANRLTRVYVA